MTFKHKAILPKVEDWNYRYSTDTGEEDGQTWNLDGYCGDEGDSNELFYLRFHDCHSADDKEGFLLMCSENELVQLVNHLRMIRGI